MATPSSLRRSNPSSVLISLTTGHLYEVMDDAQRQMEQYVTLQKGRADDAVRTAQHSLHLAQQDRDAANATLLSLKLQSSVELGTSPSSSSPQQQNKDELDAQLQQQQSTRSNLAATVAHDQHVLEDTKRAHQADRVRYEAAQLQKQQQRTALLTTIDDLTTGILQYKLLGLDFSKADHDRLKFTFRHLSDDSPNANDNNNNYSSPTASFELETAAEDDDEHWNVVHCTPPLSEAAIQEHLRALNDSNDMGTFVRGMRTLFVEHFQ